MAAEIFNKDELFIRLMEDQELVDEVLGVFCNDLPGYVEKLKEAIATVDYVEIHRVGHTIKGACGNVSAYAMRDISNGIEKAGSDEDLEKATKLFKDLEVNFELFKKEIEP